jgi:hypothetical protein
MADSTEDIIYEAKKSQEAFFADTGEACSSNVDVLSLHDTAAQSQIATCKLEIWITGGRM